MANSKPERDAIVDYALRNSTSYDIAAAELEYGQTVQAHRYRALGDRVRYERVQMLEKDYSAQPMTNRGEGLEPARAAGPHGPKPDADVEAAPDVDMMIGDPDLGQSPDQRPRVRVFVDREAIGDVVVTPDGVRVEADGQEAKLIRRLLDANNVTDVEALRQLPSKLGERTPGGLRAVWIDGQGDESGLDNTGDDRMDAWGLGDDEPEMDREPDINPAFGDEADEFPMADEADNEEEDEEQPVRMSRRYIRVGDRLIYTKPIW